MNHRRPPFVVTTVGVAGLGALALACGSPCNASGDPCCPLEGEERTECYADADPENWDRDGDGYNSYDGDCHDEDPAVHPSATEECNDKDDNCDGRVDEGLTLLRYRDTDADGWGATAVGGVCPDQEGYADRDGDCDDSEPSTHPGAEEACDGVDQDCDSLIDEDCGDSG